MRVIKTLTLTGTHEYGSNTIGEIVGILPDSFHKFTVECSCGDDNIGFCFEITNADNDGISPDDVAYVLNRIRDFVSYDTICVYYTYFDIDDEKPGVGAYMFDLTQDTDNVVELVYKSMLKE